jgi:uncharacterized protein
MDDLEIGTWYKYSVRFFVQSALVVAIGLLSGLAQNAPGPGLIQQAQSGDAAAQLELGRAYQEGKGVPRDDGQAVGWFRKAADQGNAAAQNSLGVMYSEGRGVPRDKDEAVRWYKKAAKQGLPEGFYNVAISYFNGEGPGEDIPLAWAWMELARRNGDAQAAEALQRMKDELHGRTDAAKFKLALLYDKGNEIQADPAAAVAMYEELAKLDPRSPFAGEAQLLLCRHYADGRGVAQDYATARSWCKKAVTRSEMPARGYMFLATTAERGQGTSVNLKEAADWYRLAFYGGAPEAAMQMGRLRLAGGSHEDQRNAYFWFTLAAYRKTPGASAAQQDVAAKLNAKELSEQQKKFNEWIKMHPYDQFEQLKKH